MQYKLYRLLNAKESYERTLDILSSDYVEYVALNKDTVVKAVELSHSKNIRINDALIAQHVLDLNASLLTDNLRDFSKVEELSVIPLR